MIGGPVGQLHPRPAGDPAQLRNYAHRLGAMGEQVRHVMRPYPVAMQTASMHMPIRRLPGFALLGNDAMRRRRRLLNSLGQMSAALLDYARVLERAQDAVDAANRRRMTGLPPTPGRPRAEPTRGDHMVHEPFDTTTRSLGPGVVDDDMVRLPAGLTRQLRPIDGPDQGGDEDAEAALSDLRRARQRCLQAMNDIERDWPFRLRTGPVRLPIFAPVNLPVRHTGPPSGPPMMPIGRVRLGSPPERVPLLRAGGVEVVGGRVRASQVTAGAIPVGRLAQSVPA